MRIDHKNEPPAVDPPFSTKGVVFAGVSPANTTGILAGSNGIQDSRTGSACHLNPRADQRELPFPRVRVDTHRGLEIDLHLKPGLPEENFVAEAIGNVAAFRLQRERGEPLSWQVVRVEGSGAHHFRLVIRHPDRVLDIGIGHELKRLLDSLSDEAVEGLRRRFDAARREGLKPTRLRHVHESVDFWQDDFWNWLG